MIKTLRTLLLGLLVAIFAFAAVPPVEAASITLTSGSASASVTDNAPGDLNPALGMITFIGSVGGFVFNLAVGETKPSLGSATSPVLDLDLVAFSVIGGTLTVEFEDTLFGPTGPMLATANAVGLSGGSLTYSTYQDAALLTTATSGFGAYSFLDLAPAPGGPAYSLTQEIVITHAAGPRVSTFFGDLILTPMASVPDGGWAIGLLGFGLVGIEGLRRRFSRL